MSEREKHINQLKNWLYQHFCLVRTAKDAGEGEEFIWLIPSPKPGEAMSDFLERMDEKVCFAELELSIERKAEMERIAGTLVDMLLKFMVAPLEKELTKLKGSASKIKVPTQDEIRRLGN